MVLMRTPTCALSTPSASPPYPRIFSLSDAFVESAGMKEKIVNSESERMGGGNGTRDNLRDMWKKGEGREPSQWKVCTMSMRC